MSEQLSDQMLVEQVQKDDKRAFNLLVIRQYKVVNLVSCYVFRKGCAGFVDKSRLSERIEIWNHFVGTVHFILGCIV
ncbi:MAG: hypothetical protein HNEKOMLI_00737 [Sodalis sp. Psp]|nr:hypothetical protein [Sodalis sp. Psp]MCR3757286.1 hypothetical protein [Sodalis sp. Ppy]